MKFKCQLIDIHSFVYYTMFASGTPGWMRMVFMFSTMLVAVPTGVKVFAWTATVWGGKLHLETGMVRRVASYDPQYQGWNVIASLGGFLLGVATLRFIVNMVVSWLQGPKASDNPWHATGLEWTVSSPPVENFAEIPVVTLPPYHYVDSPESIAQTSAPE